MNTKLILTATIGVFLVFCGYLVLASGVFSDSCQSLSCTNLQAVAQAQPGNNADNGQAIEVEQAPAQQAPTIAADNAARDYRLISAEPDEVEIGSIDPETGYKFMLRLDTAGAAVSDVYMSGFFARNFELQQPLRLLQPAQVNGRNQMTLATRSLTLVDEGLRFPLDQLNWQMGQVQQSQQGQLVEFESFIYDGDEPVVRLVKIYEISRESYHISCRIRLENLDENRREIAYSLNGAVGMEREELRTDMRQAMAAFHEADRIAPTTVEMSEMQVPGQVNSVEIRRNDMDRLLWVAGINKYFAAILVPRPHEDQQWATWVDSQHGWYYNPPQAAETMGVSVDTTTLILAGADHADSVIEHEFLMYFGPKDNRVFSRTALYNQLGFVHTIGFRTCCCPDSVINPLAFGLLGIISFIYSIIPNYGIAIIILVLLIRLILHPITKSSQVSMSKFSKLGPKMEEIKQRYADNKQELNRRMMELYKEQGASPIKGMLPMLLQMPIWIALYSAIHSSVELRGEPFLPFWITDLSSPDALISFPEFTIPLLGGISSLNLLPLMMGVAMYLQQKLLAPATAAASTNPQAAQQQKMMMIMMPLMMPLFLYNAPSGLNLYIMSSVFAGVIEQYYIRKHIRQKDELESQGVVSVTSKTGGKAKKKKPKPYYRNM